MSDAVIELEKEERDRRKRLIKKMYRVFLGVCFIFAVLASVWYITDDSKKVTVSKRSNIIKSDVMSPSYIPNSVLYASNEEIRVAPVVPDKKAVTAAMIEEAKEKRKAVFEAKSKEKKNQNSEAKQKSESLTSEPTVNGLPPFLAASGDCFEVSSPGIYSLVKDQSEIYNKEKTAFWTLRNLSTNTVSMIVSHGSKDIVVVMLPPGKSLSTKIPASYLKFALRHSETTCIKWAGGGFGSFSNMPEVNAPGVANPYLNGIIETTIVRMGQQLKATSKLIGYSE